MNFDRMILVDKPAGMSSFGVVARVRRVLSEEASAASGTVSASGQRRKIKVGHTGTLDPFATGLLILMTGKNTKKCQEFLKLDKVYEATLKLGFTSTTGDPEGEITAFEQKSERDEGTAEQKVETRPSLTEVKKVVQSFTGKISQTLPRFSAVRINGQRAYKLARKGEKIEMPTRKVTIYSAEVLSYDFPFVKIRCHVSSGTYIRTLGEDIGAKLGTGAYLTELRRIKIGQYDVADAVTLEELGISD